MIPELISRAPPPVQSESGRPSWYAQRDWIFLLPLVLACLVAYLRFPLLQNDDHLKVVRFISEYKQWPPVPRNDRNDQAQHTLFHHTLAALVYSGLEMLRPFSPHCPERGVQLLSLLWAMGVIFLVRLIVRRLVEDHRARALAFLVFGTFAGWVRSSVTIDNDMAMSFWGSWALLVGVEIMRKKSLPSIPRVAFWGFLIGLAAFTKVTGSVMAPIALGSILSRRWFYREPWRPLLTRFLILLLCWGGLASHNYFRYWRDTGYLINHQSFHERPTVSVPGERWDYFSFRFMDILRRPFKVDFPFETDERLSPADYSFWSKFYVTWWCLGVLPHSPNPWATSALYLMALPASACGVAGFFLAIRRLRREPAWIALVGWPVIGVLGIFLASWYIPEICYGSFINPRFLGYTSGCQVALLALGFQTVVRNRPPLRTALWVAVLLQLVCFWWLLLSGPFYSFWNTWPSLSVP